MVGESTRSRTQGDEALDPVRVHRPKDGWAVEVEVWGRATDRQRRSIEQVESAGRQILSAPVELVSQVKNGSVEWQGGEASAVTVEETHAMIEQRFTSEVGLQAKLRHRLEFDGFGKTELVIESAEPVPLNSLALVGRWLPKASNVYFCWPPGKWGSSDVLSGRLDAEVVADFKPIVFLGNKDLGFAWYFESYQGWTSWSRPGAVQLIPSSAGETESPKTTESIFSIVDREVLVSRTSLSNPIRMAGDTGQANGSQRRDLRMFRPEGYCRELDCRIKRLTASGTAVVCRAVAAASSIGLQAMLSLIHCPLELKRGFRNLWIHRTRRGSRFCLTPLVFSSQGAPSSPLPRSAGLEAGTRIPA